MTRKGRVRKASRKMKKLADDILTGEFAEYLYNIEGQKKTLGDYTYIRTIYRDKNGKYVPKEKARELLKKGIKLKKEHRYYLKTDLPEYNLHKGQQIPKKILSEVLDAIKDEIRKYNTALTVSYIQDMDFEDAMQLVNEVFEAYENGEITAQDVHDILSP